MRQIEYDTDPSAYTAMHWSVFPTPNPEEYVATYTGVLIPNFSSGTASGGWKRDQLRFSVPLKGLPPAKVFGHSALRLHSWTVFVTPNAVAGDPVQGFAVDYFDLQVNATRVVDFDAYVRADLAIGDRQGGGVIRIAYQLQLVGERFDSSAGKL